jgi:hypothetical protein
MTQLMTGTILTAADSQPRTPRRLPSRARLPAAPCGTGSCWARGSGLASPLSKAPATPSTPVHRRRPIAFQPGSRLRCCEPKAHHQQPDGQPAGLSRLSAGRSRVPAGRRTVVSHPPPGGRRCRAARRPLAGKHDDAGGALARPSPAGGRRRLRPASRPLPRGWCRRVRGGWVVGWASAWWPPVSASVPSADPPWTVELGLSWEPAGSLLGTAGAGRRRCRSPTTGPRPAWRQPHAHTSSSGRRWRPLTSGELGEVSTPGLEGTLVVPEESPGTDWSSRLAAAADHPDGRRACEPTAHRGRSAPPRGPAGRAARSPAEMVSLWTSSLDRLG